MRERKRNVEADWEALRSCWFRVKEKKLQSFPLLTSYHLLQPVEASRYLLTTHRILRLKPLIAARSFSLSLHSWLYPWGLKSHCCFLLDWVVVLIDGRSFNFKTSTLFPFVPCNSCKTKVNNCFSSYFVLSSDECSSCLVKFFSVVLKVGMIGDSQVGKTALMIKFVEDTFDEVYVPTSGISFMEKTVSSNRPSFSLFPFFDRLFPSPW